MNSMNYFPLLAEGGSDAVENLLHWACGLVGVPTQVGVPLILILATLGAILGGCSYSIWPDSILNPSRQFAFQPDRIGTTTEDPPQRRQDQNQRHANLSRNTDQPAQPVQQILNRVRATFSQQRGIVHRVHRLITS